MNCEECQKLIVVSFDNMLDDSPKREITEHLQVCAECCETFNKLNNLHNRLRHYQQAVANDSLEHRVMDSIGNRQGIINRRYEMAKRYARVGIGLAAALAIVIGVMSFLWTPTGKPGYGVVFADVIQHMRKVHTVKCKSYIYQNNQIIGQTETMYKGDHLMRIKMSSPFDFSKAVPETPDFKPKTIICDFAQPKMLLLDTENKVAMIFDEGKPQYFDFYKIVTEFKDGSEKGIGIKIIEGRDAVGFLIDNNGQESTFWVDPQTQLPIQIEQKLVDRNGVESTEIVKDFLFDAVLDDSLFSLEIPEGYKDGRVEFPAITRAKDLSLRVVSAASAVRIAKACIKYAKDNSGQWPEDLKSLEAYGIDAQALINARQPDIAVGWVYLRPSVPLHKIKAPANKILLHEVFEEWGEGINVVNVDGHVQFLKDQAKFNGLIGK
ncbi:MAG: zf-HC2 domain-containing protein [Planctomycetota bacterium]|jgi:outer membrane lipoprotein-sorting protein